VDSVQHQLLLRQVDSVQHQLLPPRPLVRPLVKPLAHNLLRLEHLPLEERLQFRGLQPRRLFLLPQLRRRSERLHLVDSDQQVDSGLLHLLLSVLRLVVLGHLLNRVGDSVETLEQVQI